MDTPGDELAVAQVDKEQEQGREDVQEDSSPSLRSTHSSTCTNSSECRRKSAVYVYSGGDASGPFTITLKHYDSLVSECKCPGCAEPMDGAISLCATGHSLCHGCRHKCTHCPLCDAQFTELRNYTLEAIASKVQFPCGNAARGCTVRLPLQLLRWHRERCGYKLIECFMGKVWDGCSWHGCERDWLEHCVRAHSEQVYETPQLDLRWDYGAELAPVGPRTTQLQLVVAYYLARAYGEAFNLYQVFDPDSRTVLWTVICATKEPKVAARYAFELELYSTVDSWKLLVQRFPCHSELDPDFLKDGHCAKLPLGEAIRFMAPDKVLHYRVRILEVGPSRCQSLATISAPTTSALVLPPSPPAADYSCTRIEHVNLKAVPAGNIIIRKQAPTDGRQDDDDNHDDDEVFLPATVEQQQQQQQQQQEPIPAPLLYRRSSSCEAELSDSPAPEKPARVTFDQLHHQQQLLLQQQDQQQDQQLQQLVRVRLVDQEQPVRATRLLVESTSNERRARSVERMGGGSCESLTKQQQQQLAASKPASGLSRFYNVTMYKAAKYLEKKSQHRVS